MVDCAVRGPIPGPERPPVARLTGRVPIGGRSGHAGSVSRPPFVPDALTARAFDLAEARRHGLTKDRLRMAGWRRIGHELYAWHDIASQPIVLLTAFHRRLPEAVFSGRTAAWLHGLECDPVPAEVTLPIASRISRRAGLVLHRAALDKQEIAVRRGLPVTTRVRTFADLGRRLKVVDAVVVLDQAMHQHLVTRRQLSLWADAHAQIRGVARLRNATAL